MKYFYRNLFNTSTKKIIFNRLLRVDNAPRGAWSLRHIKILKHAGLGGKKHLLVKGHVQWNRKGRW
jgi:hypothetical protein